MHAQAALDSQSMTELPGSKTLPAAQLARRATGGDLDAFEELIGPLQRRVYRFALQPLRPDPQPHRPRDQIPTAPGARPAPQPPRRCRGDRRDPMSEMPCGRVRVLLESYVDGDLIRDDPGLAASVRDHLAECADCRRQHD